MATTTIRQAVPKEIDSIFLQWAKDEKWNPGLTDLPLYRKIDSNAFWVRTVTKDGKEEIASIIGAAHYSTDFGFIGFYIAQPKYRGQGHGLPLFQHALSKYLVEEKCTNCIGLDGVLAQVQNYEKSGFKTSFVNTRYFHTIDAKLISSISTKEIPDVKITNLAQSEKLIQQILKLDERCFPTSRKEFLSAWAFTHHTICLLDKDDALLGYATLRPSEDGYRVGPLFVVQNNEDHASILLRALAKYTWAKEGKKSSTRSFSIDVPEVNTKASSLISSLPDWKKYFSCARMYYKGVVPKMDTSLIYGFLSLEFS
eukprot:TRINITY_DN1562_c0_g1_i1.p1 TRINITY_DN1562_c0_g1~~TRINITY_DN1562_c0_g1_i1.p1  ORF type:complete len:312 (-),score=28.00 TRINITY_DN1562_c0_g1_i1:5-940(-)